VKQTEQHLISTKQQLTNLCETTIAKSKNNYRHKQFSFSFFFILKMIEERVERGRTESSQKLSSVKQKRETSKTLYEKLGHKTHLREA